jgi:2-methylcitrate dehydratase PrpD
MDPAFTLADAVAATRYEALPPATVVGTKRLILDALAVALAGADSRECRVLAELGDEWGGCEEASILGSSRRLPAPVAALVNGTMIQALDFDDTHDPSGTHVASSVLAAALAAAERGRRSGPALLTAVVAGTEVACRLGLACHDKIGFTSTAVYGAFGAAAAAASALGLGPAPTRHALGIVLSQVAGTTQTAIEAPLSKHMQSGFAARAGLLSALLAARGVTGVENVFEGQYGFLNLYKQGRYDRGPLLAAWGERYEIDRLSLKPFPCCRATHAPIEAALAVAREGALRPQDIAGIRVVVPRVAFQLAGRPAAGGNNPIVAAQFSIHYTVACALLHGQVSLPHFTLDAVRDPRLRALMERITVTADDGDGFVPAHLELRTADGVTRSRTVTTLKGDAERPLSPAELLDKVADCLARREAPEPPAARAAALAALVEGLDAMDCVDHLVRGLEPREGRSVTT